MRTVVLSLVAAALATPALAHHSVAAIYDRDRTVEMQGVLSRIEVQNPHSALEIAVQDPSSGRPTVWQLEGRGVDGMNRSGFDARSVAVGDRVTVKGSPSRAGDHKLWLASLTTAGGRLYNFDLRRGP